MTSRLLSRNPPTHEDLVAARGEVDRLLTGIEFPEVGAGLAVGGSARALKRLVGGRLGADELDYALSLLELTPAADLVERYGVNPSRAEILPAGATILTAIQARLDTSLRVVRAGLREGAVGELTARERAA